MDSKEIGECPFCLESINNPHVLSCCGQVYCDSCHDSIQKNCITCPLCRACERQTVKSASLEQYFADSSDPTAWGNVDEKSESDNERDMRKIFEFDERRKQANAAAEQIRASKWPKELRLEGSILPMINVTFKTLDCFTVNMKITDLTVGRLKRAISEAVDCCHETIRLIFKGSPMYDDCPISRWVKNDGDLVHVIHALRGS